MFGRIHSFQSLGTVDGPGVRCVIFMQGCPLRCICCHNPDTWDPCGGEPVDSDTLVRKVLRYRNYLGTRGGVTVSGGEPLLQAPFVAELFHKLKTAGIHTALDTSGCILNDSVERLLDQTDLVLLDHKYASEEAYRQNCGGSMLQTERFLARLQEKNLPVWIRRVIIPGKTDHPEEIAALNDLTDRFSCIQKIELLPFRNLCQEKYDTLGIPFPLAGSPSPSEECMKQLNDLILHS